VQAVALGVDGLIVSNHGGRQLDGAISSAEALPGIVAAVVQAEHVAAGAGRRRHPPRRRRGEGARDGRAARADRRPQLWGLAVAGEAGVGHVLNIYRARSTG
jgi:isopentenyl diphosphate isomerase/L-lactate dehydrogenase-like FMN-dependent dehydrogenase